MLCVLCCFICTLLALVKNFWMSPSPAASTLRSSSKMHEVALLLGIADWLRDAALFQNSCFGRLHYTLPTPLYGENLSLWTLLSQSQILVSFLVYLELMNTCHRQVSKVLVISERSVISKNCSFHWERISSFFSVQSMNKIALDLKIAPITANKFLFTLFKPKKRGMLRDKR